MKKHITGDQTNVDNLALRMNSTVAAMALNALAKYDQKAVSAILKTANKKAQTMPQNTRISSTPKVRWVARWYARDGTIREMYFNRYCNARAEAARHKDGEVFRQERRS